MPFAAAIDAIFEGPLGTDALYVPAAGVPVPVRVLRKSPDERIDFRPTEVAAETNVFELRVSEVPAPRKGDRLEMGAGGPGAEAFEIQAKPTRDDPDRLVWTLDTRPL